MQLPDLNALKHGEADAWDEAFHWLWPAAFGAAKIKLQPFLPADVEDVVRMAEALDADSSRVLLMAEGTSPEKIRDRAVWIVEECKRLGYRYSPRLHVDLWGDRRGV